MKGELETSTPETNSFENVLGIVVKAPKFLFSLFYIGSVNQLIFSYFFPTAGWLSR